MVGRRYIIIDAVGQGPYGRGGGHGHLLHFSPVALAFLSSARKRLATLAAFY